MIRFFFLMWIPLSLFAIEGKVKLEIKPNQEFFVSKKIIVTLKVMSTGFKMDNLNVNFGKNRKFIIIAPNSAAYTVSEDDFNVVVYEYELYPLEKGQILLQPWKVSFSSSLGYGMPKENFVCTSTQKQLTIASIKGYDFLLATPRLTATTSFIAKSNTLNVGDAITRKIVLKAYDVPDILIPHVETLKIKGIKNYPEEAQLSQTQEEKHLVSTRIEEDVFVLNKEGNYSIPSTLFYWYNTDLKRVEKEYTKKFSFEVKALPKPDVIVIEKGMNKKELLFYTLFIVGALLSLFLLYRLTQVVKRKKKHKLFLYNDTLLGRLDLLINACDQQDVVAVYNAFYRWGECLGLKQVNLTIIAQHYPLLKEDLNSLNLALNGAAFDFFQTQKNLRIIKKQLQIKEVTMALTENINPVV